MAAPRPGEIAALGVIVLAAHLWLIDQALPSWLGDGAAPTRPTRIKVAFVRQLEPSAPAPVVARSAPRRAPGLRPAAAASASAAQADEPEAPAPVAQAAIDPPQPQAPTSTPEAAPATASAASAPLPPLAAASAAERSTLRAPDFEWPPSTRLSYRLSGNYRGAVEGQARVEWLRSGQRYQVFMDLGIGPSFAPLMSRRVSSDGEITALGLHPLRYDEETKVVLRDARRLTIFLDADRIRLPSGSEGPRPPGVQDSASQFVQLTWLFTTQPELLQAGRSIEMPLALPRVVEPWTYDVIGRETLDTPAGPVETVHVKPRREARPGSDLTAEIWVAPSLQYLPVRILIRQSADTWIDLAIERLPEQADPRR